MSAPQLSIDLVEQARWCHARVQELGLPDEALAYTFAAALYSVIQKYGPNHCSAASRS